MLVTCVSYIFTCLTATPPPDHLLQHTDQSKQQMMNMYSNITTTSSSSMPNLAQQVPGVNYPRYLSNNTPSPLDDSMVRMQQHILKKLGIIKVTSSCYGNINSQQPIIPMLFFSIQQWTLTVCTEITSQI